MYLKTSQFEIQNSAIVVYVRKDIQQRLINVSEILAKIFFPNRNMQIKRAYHLCCCYSVSDLIGALQPHSTPSPLRCETCQSLAEGSGAKSPTMVMSYRWF